ncbi:hypothetical protein VNI00_012996 [Paramarasmius palmivorus]|uniref:Uncharacterized protein n=1 Tax=Paramarasmius palmivorus TaxID=297713 RepID=A0AAW0BYN4_9AGAR
MSDDDDTPLKSEAFIRSMFHSQKHRVDETLESVLDRLQSGTLTRDEARKDTRGHLVSTNTQIRRCVFRFWPRDPRGTIYRGPPVGKFKHAPNATELWGASLFDFYHTYRVPALVNAVTTTTGSRMLAWCKMVGELDAAKEEISWAEKEPEPRKIEPADVVEIHRHMIDFKLPCTRYGKAVIEQAKSRGYVDNNVEHWRTPFHPSSYPPSFPAPPFSCPNPRLETTIPLHLLPQKLIVHDPHNVLHGKRFSPKPDPNADPWPRETDTSYPKHTYTLQLTTQTRTKVTQTRSHSSLSQTPSTENVLYIYPSTTEGPTHTPLIRIIVPARPPRPLCTPEAHLFLSEHKQKGQGHHSLVYEAEWEIPRNLFPSEDPKICYACVEAKAKEIWMNQNPNEETSEWRRGDKDPDTLRVELTRLSVSDDVVLPPEADGDDDEKLEEYIRELEAQLDPEVLASVDSTKDSTPTPAPSATGDYIDPKPSRIESCGLPLEGCKTWGTVSRRDENCGSIWIDSNARPVRKKVEPEIKSLNDLGLKKDELDEKKEWAYGSDVTEEMKAVFEKDRVAALGLAREQKEERERERRRKEKGKGKAKESDNIAHNEDVKMAPPPVSEESKSEDEDEHYYLTQTIFYSGIVRTINISSVPWILPGDPPCPVSGHGTKHLYTPSLDPHKPFIPNATPNPRQFDDLFSSSARLPPTMKVTISAKISIPRDGHLAQEARNYQSFPESFQEHWSGLNIAYPLHEPTPCGAIVPGFYGFYRKEAESVGGEVKNEEVKKVKEEARKKESGQRGRGRGRGRARAANVRLRHIPGLTRGGGPGSGSESKAEEEEETPKPEPAYFSDILLLEDCGDPIDPEELSLDDRYGHLPPTNFDAD